MNKLLFDENKLTCMLLRFTTAHKNSSDPLRKLSADFTFFFFLNVLLITTFCRAQHIFCVEAKGGLN